MSEQKEIEAVATYLAAARAYTAALASFDVAKAVAPGLPCREVAVIAEMIEKAGHPEEADWWLFVHSTEGDIDEFDEHADYWREVSPAWR
ncbi:hypothetical protein [Rathayibacter sp. SD072]|uniref:hypothetical protein n=1 Tax=Rathayibacter sp. SD072 TaxID=2781731 RepID=UPI001A956427|nr:hypothetical protein [Rathayibacter sp. SD072]MBO0984900.1 hypothetical protein [Rathayibacter sp. SD072]